MAYFGFLSLRIIGELMGYFKVLVCFSHACCSSLGYSDTKWSLDTDLKIAQN